jgi:hypothetical protein
MQWLRSRWSGMGCGGYTALFLIIGVVVVIILALVGPATGNIFSNIYSQVPVQRSLANPSPASPSTANLVTPVAVSRSNGLNAAAYRTNRLIIKNGELNLVVADTDRAIDQVTNVAVGVGGYIISSRTWAQSDFKYAALTIGIPADQFESTQRQLRTLAVQVLSDTASGQDVSDEYVDLQSQLNNLEATAARVREFLGQAKDAEQALLVNNKLTDIENQIEQIKGRMAYLKDRSTFSTLTINLEPQRPTPTPTPAATPIAWMPEKTFDSAATALSGILRTIGDLAIWAGVVMVPLAVPVVIGWAIWSQVRRKRSSHVNTPVQPPSPADKV